MSKPATPAGRPASRRQCFTLIDASTLPGMPPVYLTDRRRFPVADATTPELAKARTWAHRSGPSRYARRTGLSGTFRTLPVPAADVAAARIDARPPRSDSPAFSPPDRPGTLPRAESSLSVRPVRKSKAGRRAGGKGRA